MQETVIRHVCEMGATVARVADDEQPAAPAPALASLVSNPHEG